MPTELNPFIVMGRIPSEYFCDREAESERLIKTVTHGNNLVLISPRRMGKTGLVQHCYNSKEIRNDNYTFFIDILHTTSLREFTFEFGRVIYETLLSKSRKAAQKFIQALKSLSFKMSFNPVTGMPAFSLELGDIEQPEYSLEEIFKYLENADKHCIVAFDEFQQIASYPEKNMEAILRQHIQLMRNCNFIFAGSKRHLMEEMFLASSHPFFRSADIMELKAIDESIYSDFVRKHFKNAGKKISTEGIKRVYNLFDGHTYYMQRTFHGAFERTMKGEECSMNILKAAIDEMVGLNDSFFRYTLSNISEPQKALLYAIAAEGKAKAITSAAFIKKHKLSTASSVQAATKKLLSSDIITNENKEYSVSDKLLGIWLNRLQGFDPVSATFETES